MTVFVLKTCISYKTFQKPRRVFQTLFRKPKTKQHRASQLADLSSEAKVGNFRHSCPTRRTKKSRELPLRQWVPMFCNSDSFVYTWTFGSSTRPEVVWTSLNTLWWGVRLGVGTAWPLFWNLQHKGPWRELSRLGQTFNASRPARKQALLSSCVGLGAV